VLYQGYHIGIWETGNPLVQLFFVWLLPLSCTVYVTTLLNAIKNQFLKIAKSFL
jgi:hypothetical protein